MCHMLSPVVFSGWQAGTLLFTKQAKDKNLFGCLVILQQISSCCQQFQTSSANTRASTEMHRVRDQNRGVLQLRQQPVHLLSTVTAPEGDRILLRVVGVGGKLILWEILAPSLVEDIPLLGVIILPLSSEPVTCPCQATAEEMRPVQLPQCNQGILSNTKSNTVKRGQRGWWQTSQTQKLKNEVPVRWSALLHGRWGFNRRSTPELLLRLSEAERFLLQLQRCSRLVGAQQLSLPPRHKPSPPGAPAFRSTFLKSLSSRGWRARRWSAELLVLLQLPSVREPLPRNWPESWARWPWPPRPPSTNGSPPPDSSPGLLAGHPPKPRSFLRGSWKLKQLPLRLRSSEPPFLPAALLLGVVTVGRPGVRAPRRRELRRCLTERLPSTGRQRGTTEGQKLPRLQLSARSSCSRPRGASNCAAEWKSSGGLPAGKHRSVFGHKMAAKLHLSVLCVCFFF